MASPEGVAPPADSCHIVSASRATSAVCRVILSVASLVAISATPRSRPACGAWRAPRALVAAPQPAGRQDVRAAATAAATDRGGAGRPLTGGSGRDETSPRRVAAENGAVAGPRRRRAAAGATSACRDRLARRPGAAGHPPLERGHNPLRAASRARIGRSLTTSAIIDCRQAMCPGGRSGGTSWGYWACSSLRGAASLAWTYNSRSRGHPSMVNLNVNGTARSFDGDDDMPLLWYLRDELRLTGTRFGCGAGLCGACTVHVDGQAVRACQTPMRTLQNKTRHDHRGPERRRQRTRVQRAWAAHNVPQCGYCQSGQIMQAAALLSRTPNPTDQDIDRAMAGNICRCGTYQRIRAAIKQAAGAREAGHEHSSKTSAAASSSAACSRPAPSSSPRRCCPSRLGAGPGRAHPRAAARRSARASISASSPTARCSSSRTGRRWAPASAPRCRSWPPTSSMPTGAACASSRGSATRSTATRTPTARARFATSTTRSAAPARRRGSMLVSAAAAQWSVPAAECTAQNHEVVHRAERPQARVRRAGARRRQAAGAEAETLRSSRRPTGSSSARSAPIYDLARHHHRQGAVRPRHLSRGHGVRLDRAPAGRRRHGEERSTTRPRWR